MIRAEILRSPYDPPPIAQDDTCFNLFVDGECIRFTNGFATPVRDGAEIVILPALSGG